jgi:hypothetical protein
MRMETPTWLLDNTPPDTPNAARMYDYFLGGYHNFAIDRRAAAQAIAIYPEFPLVMQANRAFLRRAVQFLVAQGIEQFLDIGSGIPTVGNVHEVVQASNPTARVVYVDHDPIAVAHSTAILGDNPRATIIQADARQPEQILGHPQTRHLLDSGQPLAVVLAFLLHFITDDAVAHRLVRALYDAMPSGSYLVISHGTYEGLPPEILALLEQLYTRTTTPVKPRSREDIARFFVGTTLIEPGLTYCPLWRPEGPDELFRDQPEHSIGFASVGRKP